MYDEATHNNGINGFCSKSKKKNKSTKKNVGKKYAGYQDDVRNESSKGYPSGVNSGHISGNDDDVFLTGTAIGNSMTAALSRHADDQASLKNISASLQ